MVNEGETLIDDVVVTSKFYGGVVAVQASATVTEAVPQVKILSSSPTFYKVQVSKATKSFPLVFSESYNVDWQAQVVTGGQRFLLPESQHRVVNLYANAWILAQKGDFQVEISYRPERFFRIFLAVSLVTALASIIYLLSSKFLEREKMNDL